jgi:hypothetical protein
MHGNPLFRVLILGALLAVTGLIVAAVARSPRSGDAPGLPVPPALVTEASVPAVVGIQLSAPARSISLSSADGTVLHIAPHRPEEPSVEFRSSFAIRDRALTVLLSVEWESPAPNRFVHLEIEPDGLETREDIFRAPDDLEQHAITFEWKRRDD